MSVSKLSKACKSGVFPDLATVSKYGLDGVGGTNPVAIIECFRTAIQSGLTTKDIDRHFENGTLNKIILEDTMEVKYLDCYETVLQRGGIKSSWKLPQRECQKCKMCGFHGEYCLNCGDTLKQ